MEKTPHSSEKSDDDSTKKEKSSDKPSRVSRIPLPIEAVEAQRRESADAEHRETEKKEERKKKKSKPKHRKHAEAKDTDVKELEAKPETAETAEKKAEAEKQPLKLPTPEYDGELLVSDRLRRQREELERKDSGKEGQDAEEAGVESEPSTDEESRPEISESVAQSGRPAVREKSEALDELEDEDAELEVDSLDSEEDSEPEIPAETSRPTPVGEALPELNRAAPKPETGNKYPAPPAPPTPPSWRAFPPPPFDAGRSEQVPLAAAGVAPKPPAATHEQIRRPDTRSLLAGILVGGLIEHVRHKRREKRMVKQHSQEIRGLTKEQEKMRYEAAETTRRKTALETQLERLRAQVEKTKEAIVAPATAATAANLEASRVAARPLSSEQNPLTRANAEQQPTPADGRFDSPEVIAARKKLQEALVQEQEEFEAGARHLSPNRRLETSSWHHIEIDKETGLPVENPSVAYGEEFRHEQHQEQLRREIEAASTAGEETRKQYSQGGSGANGSGAPSSTGAPGLPPPASASRTPKGPSSSQPLISSAADLVLWGILTIVVIAIVVALTA